MKAALWLETKVGMVVASRVAKILEMILKEKFNKLIGLKSARVSGDLDFRMRAKKKAFEAM